MKELPKELTQELLSEILNYNISKDREQCGITRIIGVSEHEDGLSLDFGYQGLKSSYERYVWIDTLTRLMKEWCRNKGYSFNINYDSEYWDKLNKAVEIDFYDNRYSFSADTEFEAVLKATHWVTKQKGLI